VEAKEKERAFGIVFNAMPSKQTKAPTPLKNPWLAKPQINIDRKLCYLLFVPI